ncbi:MAG: PD-(D/E)XK nuclease family protein, partial [Candidatus Izemoplasmatales bacterium]|nr:PD-(D/E)XK nuclease family protein [Candidatus Izemoplasmatales bacterium]
YQIDHPQLEAYQPLVSAKYRTFDYQFRPFEFGLDTKRMQLSYTAVKTFYQCRFRYYLQYLIKLNDDSDNFYAKFGEFAHELLEQAYNPDFEFETTYEQLYAKYVFSPKEKVLLVRLKQDLAEVINFNRDHEANMSLESMLHEHTVKFRLDDITSFKGKIDKVWITKDAAGQHYLSLVDYKTSNEDFDARELPYGHSMQLPTYALLLHEDDKLKQIEVIGLYIQNIIAGKLVRPLGKDPREFYRDQLRLAGLSTSDTAKLATLDKDYQQSQYIRTIGTVKSGELKKSAKVADAATFESYRELTRTKIVEAIKEIRSHRFNIDPKRFSTSDHSCQYCPFRDICFRKEEAYINIKLDEEDDEDESAAE